MTYITNCSPGDTLRRPKRGGLIQHYGLFAGWGSDGTPYVYENNITTGVRLVPFDVFAAGQPVECIPYTGPTPRSVILQRARSALGSRYDLFRANCEHFVTWCQQGLARSPQLAAALLTAALGTLLLLTQKSNA